MVECLKIGRDWRTFYLWKNESSQGKVYLCMAFSWVHLRVWTTWVRQYSKREPQSFGLKCESLGLWNQLEIKEGNPAKDFQQGAPSSPPKNLCLYSFQTLGWTLSCICVRQTPMHPEERDRWKAERTEQRFQLLNVKVK